MKRGQVERDGEKRIRSIYHPNQVLSYDEGGRSLYGRGGARRRCARKPYETQQICTSVGGGAGAAARGEGVRAGEEAGGEGEGAAGQGEGAREAERRRGAAGREARATTAAPAGGEAAVA
eukprot:720870-Prorocentrum_minimum.AAC.1